jgi:hypothetical protein
VGNDVLHTEQAAAVLRAWPIEKRKAVPDVSEPKNTHGLEGGRRHCSRTVDVSIQNALYLLGVYAVDNAWRAVIRPSYISSFPMPRDSLNKLPSVAAFC